MEKELKEKLALYKETLYNHWCRITNNKETINDFNKYEDYLRNCLNTSLRILVGNDAIQKSTTKFNNAIEEIVNTKGRKFYEGKLNAIKVIENDNGYALVTDYIDDKIEASIVC